MLSPFVSRVALAAIGATLACSIPTDVCGCSPARSTVFVRGTLTDANGGAVAGARLYFQGVPQNPPLAIPIFIDGSNAAETDSEGMFRRLVSSSSGPAALTLRVAVVWPALPDTVHLVAGAANFRYEGDAPDTVSLTLRLP